MTEIKLNNKIPRISKRLFDIIFSISCLIILSPLLVTLYFIVIRDGGPAFYGHERVGRNGKKFKCLKFRSMSVNSQELLNELLMNNPSARKEWETTFKLKQDPRVTPIGEFLRKTSLDELPQLVNILKGEMSTVGPRPVTQQELPMYDQFIHYYLSSKPGLTGLWQVSGRSDVDYNTRVKLDTDYVMYWSFIKDIIIILKTVKVVFKKDGAY
ncbi:sugar transferase [Acinetobacter wanghuae]|uniref:Sugar transferase n=1 Tax=Acinetobacter wanghuae TaxID=2662362 RepID=A0A5Q0P4U3_9GAMM|nr:sugar transferase [Acinetobacter wanghuae]MQW92626.1 sugar transferase [Acinetobacter wanghuae]QGA12185.1 sugar transferase [Acinetobacter wanghuae]